MLHLPSEAAVLEKLIAWATARPDIRALILESSRTGPGAPVDLLSDYDVIVAVTDVPAFLRDGAWLRDYGTPLVQWGDESELYGLPTVFRGVVYEDGVKIDYSLWPEALLDRVAEAPTLPDIIDVGYRVLLDKNDKTAAWKPPTYQAHIPNPPTEAEYRLLLDTFWWSATYVAKSLWRGEIVFAQWCLEQELRQETLRPLLEWRLEIDREWQWKPGVFGRGLERLLPAALWRELRETYVGPEIENNWAALFRLMALLRQVGQEVGEALGYAYPHEQDRKMTAYLHALRETPHP